MKKCVIVGSAPCIDTSYIKKISADSFVICTDGGIINAERAKIKVDLFIGDFDSVDSSSVSRVEKIILPREKDVSDMQAAVLYALGEGMKDVVLVACTNGRADHYLANIAMLELIFENGGAGMILDEQNSIFLHPTGKFNISAQGYKYISLISLDREIGPVTISGMKYELKDEIITRKNPLAISNEDIGEDAYIDVVSGRALVIYANDKF